MAFVSQTVDGDVLHQSINNQINTNEIMKRIDEIKQMSSGVIGGPDAAYIGLSNLFRSIAEIGVKELAKAAAVHVHYKPNMSETDFTAAFSNNEEEVKFFVDTHRTDHTDGGFGYVPGYSQDEFDALPPAAQILRIADETARVIAKDQPPTNGKESVSNTTKCLHWTAVFLSLVERYLGVQHSVKFSSLLGRYAEELKVYNSDRVNARWMSVQGVRNQMEDAIKDIMSSQSSIAPKPPFHEPKIDIVVRSNGRQQGATYLSNAIATVLEMMGYKNVQNNSLNANGGTIHSAHMLNNQRHKFTVERLQAIPIYIEIEQFDNDDKQWRDGKGRVIGERTVSFDFSASQNKSIPPSWPVIS